MQTTHQFSFLLLGTQFFANFGNPKRERCFVKTLKKLFLRETKQAIHEQRESTPLGVPGTPAVPGNLI